METTRATPVAGGERRTMFFGAMQAARAKLVLIKGDDLDGISYALAGTEHLAGRLEGVLVFRDDPFLSPRHASFVYREGKLHVIDEGSANGVYIRIRVPMPILSGDSFIVGEQVLWVETAPPEAAGLGPDETGTYFYASPQREARFRLLQQIQGGETGQSFRVSNDVVTMGREGNDINFPDDPFISGRHAQVWLSDAGLMLTDLGSKNGTFLRIRGEAMLQHGDYLFMGQQLLRVEIV
ncbi:MAG: FHA domain-containing protein [Pseudomonadota bacterium]